jgi:hypothetical protein
MSENELQPVEITPKERYSPFAILAALLFIATFAALAVCSIDYYYIPCILKGLTILSGIIAFFQILATNSKRKGIILSLIVVLLMLGINVDLRWHELTSRMVCQSHMSELGKAIFNYKDKHDGHLPQANWCDLIRENSSVSLKQLICPKSHMHAGECSYVMNKFVAGSKLSDLPLDTVILFETDSGNKSLLHDANHPKLWNLCGGPELLTFLHYEGKRPSVCVLYADGHVLAETDPNCLRWKP